MLDLSQHYMQKFFRPTPEDNAQEKRNLQCLGIFYAKQHIREIMSTHPKHSPTWEKCCAAYNALSALNEELRKD